MGIKNKGTLSTIAYPTFEQLANREESIHNGALLIFPTRQVFSTELAKQQLSLSIQSVSFQLHFSLIFSFHYKQPFILNLYTLGSTCKRDAMHKVALAVYRE